MLLCYCKHNICYCVGFVAWSELIQCSRSKHWLTTLATPKQHPHNENKLATTEDSAAALISNSNIDDDISDFSILVCLSNVLKVGLWMFRLEPVLQLIEQAALRSFRVHKSALNVCRIMY